MIPWNILATAEQTLRQGLDPVSMVLILLFAVVVLALLATKSGIPYPTMMVLGGLVICLVPYVPFLNLKLPSFNIEPKLIFLLFLPPLLYGAAWQTSWKDFGANLRPISALAIALVLITTAGIAILAKTFIPGFTWPAAFALGAIISPPDAIAVTALTKKIRLPRRVVFLLEGESLVNDATALVALRFAVAAVLTGAFSLWQATGEFVLVAGGGLLVGLITGYVVSELHRRINDPVVETIITFLTPYGAYILAEHIHLSGVLAVVVAGLYVSWQAPTIFAPQTRLQANTVWEFVLFVLNGFVFVLVGLQVPTVISELPDVSVAALIGYAILLTAGTILIRLTLVLLWPYIRLYMTPKAFRSAIAPPKFKHLFLIGWTGMRGVVSLAAALALPTVTHYNEPFPARGMIVFLTFFIILVTLIFQSLTLPLVVKLIRLPPGEDEAAEEREARVYAAKSALVFLKEVTESTDAFGPFGEELRHIYEARLERLEHGPVALPISTIGVELTQMDLHREALATERRALIELRATRKISNEVFMRIMSDLDAEELRMPGRG